MPQPNHEPNNLPYDTRASVRSRCAAVMSACRPCPRPCPRPARRRRRPWMRPWAALAFIAASVAAVQASSAASGGAAGAAESARACTREDGGALLDDGTLLLRGAASAADIAQLEAAERAAWEDPYLAERGLANHTRLVAGVSQSVTWLHRHHRSDAAGAVSRRRDRHSAAHPSLPSVGVSIGMERRGLSVK